MRRFIASVISVHNKIVTLNLLTQSSLIQCIYSFSFSFYLVYSDAVILRRDKKNTHLISKVEVRWLLTVQCATCWPQAERTYKFTHAIILFIYYSIYIQHKLLRTTFYQYHVIRNQKSKPQQTTRFYTRHNKWQQAKDKITTITRSTHQCEIIQLSRLFLVHCYSFHSE